LCYHRVAEPEADPFDLAVSPRHFAEQMEVLRRFGPRLKFGEFAAQLTSGQAPRRSVCVTFDDGYRDNLHAAVPILAATGTPATVFVISGTVGVERTFWWDSLVDVFLSPGRLPDALELRVNGTTRRWELGEAADYSADEARAGAGWIVNREAPRDPRQKTMLEIWSFLCGLTTVEAERLADEIAGWAGVPRASRREAHPVDLEELRRLSANANVEIGGHTVTHPRLTLLSPDRRLAEMRDSRIALGEMTGCEITSFAYPFGDHCAETALLAGEAGYQAACNTWGRTALPDDDPMRIPRIIVGDWDGDRFAHKMRNYTMF
jgi:peptidoglycan/xylan/chitin deacetylase (PgdA/CDA1 family)